MGGTVPVNAHSDPHRAAFVARMRRRVEAAHKMPVVDRPLWSK
jgi:hypothetical protein